MKINCKYILRLYILCLYLSKETNKQQNNTDMNRQEIKKEIELLAKEENITFIKACQMMQSAASKMNSEKMIIIIHELKMESLETEC